MKSKYEQLVDLLEEMFQFDNEDLDFGIYRIMNQKRDEIRKFLRQDLLPQVKQAFKKYHSVDQVNIRNQLEQLQKNLQDAGVDPEKSPKYKALQEQLAQSIDLSVLEDEVYSHLVTFFSRYYDKGDFISKRRYKKDTYAIPYEGEEVKLYWANADQYYVKTSEFFRDYSFKLPSEKRVHFVLTEASTEQNNNKEQEGKERRFILCDDSPMHEENGELFIRFAYRENKEKQTTLNQQAVEGIFSVEGYTDWLEELRTLAPTEKNENRTLLEKHLNDYTAKNTFDYFIHKDLGGFLRRELDFYIKNEMMHLDDLDTENEARIEQYLSKIKVVKSIGHKIIKFLEQIENFQKKLWLKKKFVVETNYCVTLDRVPEELYPQIVQNHEQIEEWKRLFAIDAIEKDLINPGYSEPLTVEFLKANPYLLLDTKFFSQSFKDKLLMSFDDIDNQTDGLLIQSENFQALNLLLEKYKKLVSCIYIDPPYNKGGDGFVYKDNYKHSSWLTMMRDRLILANIFMNPNSRLAISIDDVENGNLICLEREIFGEEKLVGNITWEKRTKAQNTETARYMLQSKVEYIHVIRMNLERQEFNLEYKGEKEYPFRDEEGKYRLQEIGQMSSQGMRGRQTMIYPIKGIMPNENMQWKIGVDEINRLDAEGRIVIKDKKPYILFRPKHEDSDIYTPFWSHFFEKDVYGTAENGLNEVGKQLGFGNIIETVKPVKLIQKLIFHIVNNHDLILDFFAGSGTTAHAVINLNREDGGSRKYILVEMGEYFDTVMKPRIQKVIYSKEWKDGKPVSREGISHMFKYIRLESYEDTLNNLEIKRTESQQLALEQMPAETQEEYLLSYMLDIETEGSASLLNLDALKNPFDYKLKISNGTETTLRTVDVVETFNYLLGLTVRQIEVVQGFKVIKGELPTGERVLIIWRNLKEKSNEDLEKFFAKSKYNTRDNEFDYIYVNGDNHLENVKLQEDMWKVKLIEEEFKRLMFDVQDV